MKAGFRKALKIFKYLAILFMVAFWIFLIVDDFILIDKYGAENWLMYLGAWAAWMVFYLILFAIYYWIIATAVILIYYKLIKRTT